MPLLILGFVFVVGLFIYYLATTTVDKDDEAESQPKAGPYQEPEEDEDIVRDKNVIFLAGDIESMKEKYKRKK